MVVDFAYLKELMHETVGIYDHRVLNEMPPFDRINSTAELFCEHIYRELERRLAGSSDGKRVRLRRVDVWENDSSCATFEE
jgi:6-pyruvoyltetrahydropterin/6-carboxytetrahydropterin synthase